MAAKLVWSETAQRDIEAVAEYIARDSAIYAAETVERILAAGERLTIFPSQGREMDEFGRSNLREVAAGLYRVIYVFERETVTVLTVVHAARDWKGPTIA